jgi:hypothetical protein
MLNTSTSATNKTELKYKIESIDGQDVVASRVVVHQFDLYDITDDPDLWAGESLYKWEHSDAGKWVKQHSTEPPVWYRQLAVSTAGYQYIIVARLTLPDQTFFKLKFK